MSCFRSTGTLSVPVRKLSMGGGVLPPMPGAPEVSASSVQVKETQYAVKIEGKIFFEPG